MGIKEAIETINRMQADGVIERYAIGGAVAATFYLEPVATLDVDVFVEFHTEPGSQMEGEHDVRGRRRVDCMGRVATRPSDREIASQSHSTFSDSSLTFNSSFLIFLLPA